MIIYGTFCGFQNYTDRVSKFKWKAVVDECGDKINGIYLSNNELIFKEKKLKFGNRYKIDFEMFDKNVTLGITNIKKVNKNPRCDIFRKFKNEFHIISGKYKGKRDIDIPDYDLTKYCIWLGRESDNEMTIKNSLSILKRING